MTPDTLPASNSCIQSNNDQIPDEDYQAPPPGCVCLAKWSYDQTWYNAKVDQVVSRGREVVVTFTDYGNTDQVPIYQLCHNPQSIPLNEKVDVHVKQVLTKGEKCVALWDEDQVWYNAQIVDVDHVGRVACVEFIYYGNFDYVVLDNIFSSLESLIRNRPNQELVVDPNVR